MKGLRSRIAIAICAGALAVGAQGCSGRPLPFDDDGAGGTGGGGQGGGPGLELLGAPRLLLDTPSVAGQLYATLLWTGTEYLFVWRVYDGDGVFLLRLDAQGQASGGNMRLMPYENAVDLAWAGDRLAAVWKRTNGAATDVFFRTFDHLARPLIDPVKLRSSANIEIDGGAGYGPRIATINDGFAIAWYEDQVLAATVTNDGRARQGPEVAGEGSGLGAPTVSVAAAGDRFLVGWNGLAPQPGPVIRGLTNTMATRAFSDRLQPLGDAQVLDGAAFPIGTHQVLATGDGFLALWTGDSTSNMPSVDIAQLDAGGAPIASATMASPVAGSYRYAAPAAWNGNHLVVLWDRSATNETGLTLTRFTPDGVAQGAPLELPSMAPASQLAVVAHDGTVGFIWSEEIAGAHEVYFQQAKALP